MDNSKLKYIGYTLKKLRKSMLLTQQELAFESGLDIRTICLLENNKQEPLLSTLCSLAEALEMEPSEFMKEIEKDVRCAGIHKQKF